MIINHQTDFFVVVVGQMIFILSNYTIPLYTIKTTSKQVSTKYALVKTKHLNFTIKINIKSESARAQKVSLCQENFVYILGLLTKGESV